MARTRIALARIALVAALATGLSALAPTPASATVSGVRSKMYRATNHSRSNHEVRRVDIHYRISKLARRHSVAMAQRGSIFHSSTSTIQNRYLEGVRWRTWGENVGVTPGTVADLQAAFMDSPAHRANILNRDFRRVAVGTYRDADGLLWVTIVFYG
jgi:uncharacterized protein YkwD